MKVIAVADWQNCSADHVQSVVRRLREMYFKEDLWLLYDHPSLPEVIEGFSFNHGSLLLFMIQKLSHLVRASNDLQQLGYYKNWPKDYYSEVVEHRKKYYEKFLSLSSSMSSHP